MASNHFVTVCMSKRHHSPVPSRNQYTVYHVVEMWTRQLFFCSNNVNLLGKRTHFAGNDALFLFLFKEKFSWSYVSHGWKDVRLYSIQPFQDDDFDPGTRNTSGDGDVCKHWLFLSLIEPWFISKSSGACWNFEIDSTSNVKAVSAEQKQGNGIS